MKTGIYMIRNKVNNKKYIGQAVDIDRRWGEHIRELNDNKHRNQYLQNSWNKYGEDNFEFTIICQCLEQDLDKLEIHYIAHYDTYNNGYNLTLGGDGSRGRIWTDEQRARQSDLLRGKPKSEEARARISKGRKEFLKDPKNREKLREDIIKSHSRPEVKERISMAIKGKRRPPISKEHKQKLSKPVFCVTNSTVYVSCIEAERQLAISCGTVSQACLGRYKSGNGHQCRRGLKKDSPVYEFWFLSEYEEKFGKVAI